MAYYHQGSELPGGGGGTGEYNVSTTPDINTIPLLLDTDPIISAGWLIWRIEDVNPTLSDNTPTEKVVWINKQSGEIFFSIGTCNGKPYWIGSNGTQINAELDVFGDGSCSALLKFENTVNSLGDTYVGTVYGNELYTTGKFGNGFNFDGSTYIQYNTYNFGLSTDYTINFWMKSIYSSQQCLFTFSYNDNNTFNVFTNTNNGNKIEINMNNSRAININDIDIEDGNMHMITITSNGEFYVDGVIHGSGFQTSDLSVCNRYFLLGADRDPVGSINDWYNGMIDHLRVFNRPLTSSEINQLLSETPCD